MLVIIVGGIPIAMPTVLSVTLALGAAKLAKEGAIVARMSAVEEMASMDILCSDKTGASGLGAVFVVFVWGAAVVGGVAALGAGERGTMSHVAAGAAVAAVHRTCGGQATCADEEWMCGWPGTGSGTGRCPASPHAPIAQGLGQAGAKGPNASGVPCHRLSAHTAVSYLRPPYPTPPHTAVPPTPPHPPLHPRPAACAGTLTLNKLSIRVEDIMILENMMVLEQILLYAALSADIVGEEPIDLVLYNSYPQVRCCAALCIACCAAALC